MAMLTSCWSQFKRLRAYGRAGLLHSPDASRLAPARRDPVIHVYDLDIQELMKFELAIEEPIPLSRLFVCSTKVYLKTQQS
jgi:hypothetical protein